jgi:hypothetical protein
LQKLYLRDPEYVSSLIERLDKILGDDVE